MDDKDPTRSPRHYATPPRTRNFSPPARQSGSSKTPKLGDFSRIGPSLISPTSSPRPHASDDKVLSPRSHSAFPSPQRTRRGSQSVFSRDQPTSLGNFSKLLAVLQSPSRPTSAPKNVSIAVPDVGEPKPSADTTPRITILKRGAAGPSDQANPASGLPPSHSPNVVAAVDVKADDLVALPALSPKAELSSSPSEFESTSESEASDYDGTSATSLASSPSQHLMPQRKASVSDSWNSLNKKTVTIVSPPQQQSSAINTPFARYITTPPTVFLTDTRTKAQKHASLSVKLARHFVNDSLTQSQYRTADNAVHVFLDHSNINISFRRAFQTKFANGDFSARFNPSPEFNLEFFSEILLRGRQVRILNAGCSTRPDHPQPTFVDELRRLGYHVDVRERKPVVGDPKPHNRTHASSKHPRKRKTAGAPHDDTRYVEDLVDETLQTRIGESVMEFFQDQGTLVLATGDGKPAKYSDGFFAYADRALRMGWNVELVSWNLGLSSSWLDPKWTGRWGPRFRIIQLDEFLDDLWVPAT